MLAAHSTASPDIAILLIGFAIVMTVIRYRSRGRGGGPPWSGGRGGGGPWGGGGGGGGPWGGGGQRGGPGGGAGGPSDVQNPPSDLYPTDIRKPPSDEDERDS